MSTIIQGVIFNNKICRVCLSAGSNNIFYKLGKCARFLTEYLNIEVDPSDTTYFICAKCCHIVRKILSFGDIVLKANMILLDALHMTNEHLQVNIDDIYKKSSALGFHSLSISCQTVWDTSADFDEHLLKEEPPWDGTLKDILFVKTEQTILTDNSSDNEESAENALEQVDVSNDDETEEIFSETGEILPEDVPKKTNRKSYNGDSQRGDGEAATIAVHNANGENLHNGGKWSKVAAKKRQRKSKNGGYQQLRTFLDVKDKISVIFLRKEEAMAERNRLANEKRFLESKYKCTLCFKGMAYLEVYNKHMEIHSKSCGDFECEFCHKRFPTNLRRLDHSYFHRKRYRCKLCGHQGVSRSGVLRHFNVLHEQDKSVACPECARVFNKESVLENHMKYAHRQKARHECDICGTSYVSKDSLYSHFQIKHYDNGGTEQQCTVCDARFRFAALLRQHMTKHSTAREYFCAECELGFKTKSALKNHLNHTLKHGNPEKMILCEHCPRKFFSERRLLHHVREYHTKGRSYRCEQCTKTYLSRGNLNKHRKFVHEGLILERKYVCDVCGRAFAHRTIMQNHMNTHTKLRPHKCNECPADFAQPAALYTHRKLVHSKNKEKGAKKMCNASVTTFE